jgi:chromosome segregation protein
MFRFVEFEAVHWDFWQRCRVPLNASIVTIVGANGSGKTTLLDGLRTLLGQRCSKRRDERHYLRHNKQPYAWLRAVLDNRRAGTRTHPFFPILDDLVTLACRIEFKGGAFERRYAVAYGEVPFEALQASLGKDDERVQWLGLRDYQRRLAGAGLTRAIAEVLALEQGETDKLCDKSPKALLDLVFQVFEDRATLDRYEQARVAQTETLRQLDALATEHARLEANVQTVQVRVTNLHDYRRRASEREAMAAEWLPRIEFNEAWQKVASARQQRIALRHRLADLRERLAAQTAAQEEAVRSKAARLAEEDSRRVELDQLKVELASLNAEIKQIDARRAEYELLRQAASGELSIDADAAAAELQAGRQNMARIELEQQQMQQRLAALKQEREALREGLSTDPPDLVEARAQLHGAGIAHYTLEEVLEIADVSWQAAVEALLAPYRRLIVLRDASQRQRAWQIGERLRLRQFIAAPEPLPTNVPGSVFEVVRLRDAVPGWIAQLLRRTQRVEDAVAGATLADEQDWITRSGYWRERRGARHAAAEQAVFGKARLDRVLAEIKRAEQSLLEAQERSEPLRERIASLQAALAAPQAGRLLALRAEQHAQDEADHAAKLARRRIVGAAYPQTEQHEREASAATEAAAIAAAKAGDACRSTSDEIERLSSPSLDAERGTTLTAVRRQRTQWRAAGLASWLDRTANARLQEQHGSGREVRLALHRLEQDLEERAAHNDPSVEDLLLRLQTDLATRGHELELRRHELSAAVGATDSAREAYIGVLRESARRYARNVKQLASLAQVDVEHTLPHIDNSEASLAQAGMDIRFSFDGKPFGALNDGEASGGQQVVKSLVLLLALMMEDDRPGGFVFIDEPFAHLDIVNIARVSQFLLATKAQYLITTPITHNRGVFEPATLVLQTLKKRPGDAWAPAIQQLHRQGG